jgi:hypothetical protein
MRRFPFVAVLCFVASAPFISTLHADKLDDLGLDRSGKPIIISAPKEHYVLLPGQFGFVPLARPELPPSRADLKTRVTAVAKLVIAGPTEKEKRAGIKQVFPPGTTLVAVKIDEQQRAQFLIDFPESFISDPKAVAARFDWLTDSIISSLQDSPIISFELLARKPGTQEYLPLDRFLPPEPLPALETTPDLPARPRQAGTATQPQPAQALGQVPLEQYPRPASSRPTGALTGKAVYLNPGHGYTWRDSDYWGLQRGFVQNNIEDFSNVETVNQYIFAYCYNAGADVFSVRETDFNTNMVVVDNDDGAPGYVESGAGWSNSSLAGYANGHIPYISGQDPFSFGTNRLVQCVVGSPSASATWIPTIPAAGWYNVYVSLAAYTNRSPQAHYRVYHAGGETDYYLDQRMRRFTWIYIGTYYFEAGFNASAGKVVLLNDSSSTAHYVSADAVRFGGGMGLVSRGTSGTSGKPRRDEDNRYHVQFCGAPSSVYDASGDDESDGWSGRPKFGRWLKQQAEAYGAPAQDSVFLSSHTNAFDGAVHGLSTIVYTGYENTWHDRFRNYVHDEVLNDCHNGYSANFVNHGTGESYGAYGENNPSNVSDLMPIFLGEWLFHDSPVDMAMYHDPQFRRIMARAICQGIVKFWANERGTSVNLLPEPPENFRCRQLSTTSVELSWTASPTDANGIRGDAATGYKVYQSTHGRSFGPGTAVTGTSHVVSPLTPGTTYYFYVTATNAGGESFPTEVLAVKLALSVATPKLLLVSGFDKLDISTRVQIPWSGSTLYRQILPKMNTFDYIVEHARAIDNYSQPLAFDSCEDEVVHNALITLSDYAAVIWISGIQSEVSTADPTNDTSLTPAEQTALQTYLNVNHGNLFISGAEIAWDLDRFATTTFVDNVLKANYVQDDADTFHAKGLPGSIFNGLSDIAFDDGTGSTYKVNWPDVISPVGGSSAALEYIAGAAVIDDFEAIGGWKDPNYSGQTDADAASAFSIAASPTHEGSGAGDLYYVWGTGSFIREYDSSLPEFSAASTFSLWVYGDNSGHEVRICLRDSDNDLFVNSYTTINFTGWQQIVWTDVEHNPGTLWFVQGDGSLTGPNVRLDSINVHKVSAVNSGHLYFDEAVATPTGSGSSGLIAAVQYDSTYKLVYLGFPFETITDAATRNEVMKRVLDFFNLTAATPTPTPTPTPSPTPTPGATPTATVTPAPTPTPIGAQWIITYDFDTSLDSWGYSTSTGFSLPTSAHGGGMVSISSAADSINRFGFWQTAPGVIAYDTDQVFRARCAVQTDQATPQNIPTIRLRITTQNFTGSAAHSIISLGSCSYSPPVAGTKEYRELYYPAVADNLGFAFDMLDFDLGEYGTISLDSVAVEKFARSVFSGTALKTYDSDGDFAAWEWSADFGNTAWSGCTSGHSGGTISITSAGAGSYGQAAFWQSPANDLTYVADKLYRATFTMSRGTGNAAATMPWCRIRCFNEDGQMSQEFNINNGDSGAAMPPETPSTRDYEVYWQTPDLPPSPTTDEDGFRVAIDMLNFAAGESGTHILDAVTIEYASIPAYSTP